VPEKSFARQDDPRLRLPHQRTQKSESITAFGLPFQGSELEGGHAPADSGPVKTPADCCINSCRYFIDTGEPMAKITMETGEGRYDSFAESMSKFHQRGEATLLAALALLIWAGASKAEDNVQRGVQILAQGPVHEAFAKPSEANPQPTQVIPNRPPEPIQELPPDQKPRGENVQWIPGYWSWNEGKKDFIWVSGAWRISPPDRRWVPGHWTQVQGGWQWVAGFWARDEQENIPYLPTPPRSLEMGPSSPSPDDGSFYVPGCWVYRASSYLWRPGYWTPQYRDWTWTPASYSWTPAGSVYVDGYWDYPLADRGFLFAPVAIDRHFVTARDFVFTPSFVVNPFGFSSFFVQPGFSSFFFGNPFFSPFLFSNSFVSPFFRSFFPLPFFFPQIFRNNLIINNNILINNNIVNRIALLSNNLLRSRFGGSTVTKLNQLGTAKTGSIKVAPSELAQQRNAIGQFQHLSKQRGQIEKPNVAAGRVSSPGQSATGNLGGLKLPAQPQGTFSMRRSNGQETGFAAAGRDDSPGGVMRLGAGPSGFASTSSVKTGFRQPGLSTRSPEGWSGFRGGSISRSLSASSFATSPLPFHRGSDFRGSTFASPRYSNYGSHAYSWPGVSWPQSFGAGYGRGMASFSGGRSSGGGHHWGGEHSGGGQHR
jgi:hypothetical protein